PPAGGVWSAIVNMVRSGITREEGDQVVVHDLPQSGHEGLHGSVAGNASRIGQHLLAPDTTRFLAEADHMLKDAAQAIKTEALPDAGETGGIGQRLVQTVAELPPDTEAIRGQGKELALRAKPLEEHHQVELEEDHGIDAGPAAFGVELLYPLAHEAQV